MRPSIHPYVRAPIHPLARPPSPSLLRCHLTPGYFPLNLFDSLAVLLFKPQYALHLLMFPVIHSIIHSIINLFKLHAFSSTTSSSVTRGIVTLHTSLKRSLVEAPSDSGSVLMLLWAVLKENANSNAVSLLWLKIQLGPEIFGQWHNFHNLGPVLYHNGF